MKHGVFCRSMGMESLSNDTIQNYKLKLEIR